MIELIVQNYLKDRLDVPVHMEESEDDMYVVVEKTGSGREDLIDSATIAIKSYATTLYEAAELNEEVKSMMDDIVELNEISSSKLNSDYNFTDTTKKKYRYQAIYDLIY